MPYARARTGMKIPAGFRMTGRDDLLAALNVIRRLDQGAIKVLPEDAVSGASRLQTLLIRQSASGVHGVGQFANSVFIQRGRSGRHDAGASRLPGLANPSKPFHFPSRDGIICCIWNAGDRTCRPH